MIKKVLPLAISLSLVGCATTQENFTENFSPANFITRPIPEYLGMPHGFIFPVSTVKEFDKIMEELPNMPELKNYLQVGCYGAASKNSLTHEGARRITAACGGDKYAAITGSTKKGYYNIVHVLVSIPRGRELLQNGVIRFPEPAPSTQTSKPSRENPKKPASTSELLLNDSSL